MFVGPEAAHLHKSTQHTGEYSCVFFNYFSNKPFKNFIKIRNTYSPKIPEIVSDKEFNIKWERKEKKNPYIIHAFPWTITVVAHKPFKTFFSQNS